MHDAIPRLPSSIAFRCMSPGCAESNKLLKRAEVAPDQTYRRRCVVCGAYLEGVDASDESWTRSPVKNPNWNTAIGGCGAALLGLALGGPVGAIIGGVVGATTTHFVTTPKELPPKTRIPIFISFAFEDARMRDLLLGQSKHPDCPWSIVDHSAHDAFTNDWKSRMRLRIMRADALVLLIGPETYRANGALWEVRTALELGIAAFGLWTTQDSRGPLPPVFADNHVINWRRDDFDVMIRRAAAARLRD